MYSTDTVIILGKGPSVDTIDRQVFDGNLIIAINDAERIVPADISLLHDSWVIDSLRASGLRSRLYLTTEPFDAPHSTVLDVRLAPVGEDSSDLMMSRLLDTSTFEIEQVTLISALKAGLLVAEARGRRQTVYLVGFDFLPGSGFSRAALSGFSPHLDSDRARGIELQEDFLRHALYMLRDSALDVIHVGNKEFSALSPTGLNARLGHLSAPTSRDLGDVQPVAITAEVTTNHHGDRKRLETIIRAAAGAGADYVKFQKRDVESFYSAAQLNAPYHSPFGDTFRDYRLALELGDEDWEFIAALTKDLGIGWFASVLDLASFEYLLPFEPAMVKLPSTISEHTAYLQHVADNYRGPLVLSTGMTDATYEEWVLKTFVRQEKLYLLHANSAYPTPQAHCNVGVVRHYSDLANLDPRIVPGYSSHDAGWMASALAVAAGAGMVEKHVKLGNTDWAHFDAVAVDLLTSQFQEYVDNIRRAQVIVGTGEKRVMPSEHHKYRVVQPPGGSN